MTWVFCLAKLSSLSLLHSFMNNGITGAVNVVLPCLQSEDTRQTSTNLATHPKERDMPFPPPLFFSSPCKSFRKTPFLPKAKVIFLKPLREGPQKLKNNYHARKEGRSSGPGAEVLT